MSKTVDLDIPKTSAERIAEQDANRECQCPNCGRLHRKLANHPPAAIKGKLTQENEKLKADLRLIASFKGKTLLGPRLGDDYELGHQAGANKAFEEAADIAIASLASTVRGET